MFKDTNVEEGFPRPVSDFGLPPGGVDAAFSWAHNDKTYFFKDQLYWRYDEHTRRMDPGHPARSPPWRGVPSTLDDAMRWSDGEPGGGRGWGAASVSPPVDWDPERLAGGRPKPMSAPVLTVTDPQRSPRLLRWGCPAAVLCPSPSDLAVLNDRCAHRGSFTRAEVSSAQFSKLQYLGRPGAQWALDSAQQGKHPRASPPSPACRQLKGFPDL